MNENVPTNMFTNIFINLTPPTFLKLNQYFLSIGKSENRGSTKPIHLHTYVHPSHLGNQFDHSIASLRRRIECRPHWIPGFALLWDLLRAFHSRRFRQTWCPIPESTSRWPHTLRSLRPRRLSTRQTTCECNKHIFFSVFLIWSEAWDPISLKIRRPGSDQIRVKKVGSGKHWYFL
jgi:hypothetical protein